MGTERGARAGARDERGCTRPLRILSGGERGCEWDRSGF